MADDPQLLERVALALGWTRIEKVRWTSPDGINFEELPRESKIGLAVVLRTMFEAGQNPEFKEKPGPMVEVGFDQLEAAGHTDVEHDTLEHALLEAFLVGREGP